MPLLTYRDFMSLEGKKPMFLDFTFIHCSLKIILFILHMKYDYNGNINLAFFTVSCISISVTVIKLTIK